jgi:hypothetical protein
MSRWRYYGKDVAIAVLAIIIGALLGALIVLKLLR